MRKVHITQNIINGWEVWSAEVPDDAPTDGPALVRYVEENPDLVEFFGLKDSGAEAYETTEVEEV